MSFTALRRDSGVSRSFLTALNTTITKGQALTFASGYVTPATSSTAEVLMVASQAVTTGASVHLPIQVKFGYAGNTEFVALTGTTPTVANVGVKYDLSDGNTVNLALSTNSVFLVTGIQNATSKLVTGYFVKKVS